MKSSRAMIARPVPHRSTIRNSVDTASDAHFTMLAITTTASIARQVNAPPKRTLDFVAGGEPKAATVLR